MSLAILLSGCSVADPGLGDLDSLVVVPHGDEARAEVQDQEADLRHPDHHANHGDAVDQVQRNDHRVSDCDGHSDGQNNQYDAVKSGLT